MMGLSQPQPLAGVPHHSLREQLERIQEHLHQKPLDAEFITQQLVALRALLEPRFEQTERYCEALAEAPWLAPEVCELNEQSRRLREAYEHLQVSWSMCREHTEEQWRREFEDFVLSVIEHQMLDAQLRELMAPPFPGDPAEDDLGLVGPMV